MSWDDHSCQCGIENSAAKINSRIATLARLADSNSQDMDRWIPEDHLGVKKLQPSCFGGENAGDDDPASRFPSPNAFERSAR